MSKITYLFGAGASCNSLPIVEGMPKAMEDQIEFVKFSIATNENGSILKNEPTSEMLEYVEDLKWLMNASRDHAIVDTLAKKLAVTNKRNDLYKLKNVLSAFLSIEQYRHKIDPRYDAFLASLLISSNRMPDNIRILSWNYDTQIEMAYQFYCNESNIINAQSSLGVYQKFNDNWRAADYSGGFGIFKVNGSSFLYERNEARSISAYITHNSLNIFQAIKEACINYIHFKQQPLLYIHGLSFAWEPERENSNNIIEISKKHIVDADILVVIGYSFPFFNRSIDRQLLGVEGMPSLKKIYFQAPNANEVIESFSSIRNDIPESNMIPRFGCKQFFLPYEL